MSMLIERRILHLHPFFESLPASESSLGIVNLLIGLCLDLRATETHRVDVDAKSLAPQILDLGCQPAFHTYTILGRALNLEARDVV